MFTSNRYQNKILFKLLRIKGRLEFWRRQRKEEAEAAKWVPDASSDDGKIRDNKQCAEWANKLGCDVVMAADNQLFIDIDTEEQFEIYKKQIRLLRRHFYKILSVTVCPSKTGLPHRHITVTLDRKYPEMTRIALQAALGSDPTRELISIKRSLGGQDNVVVFFEKKNLIGRMIEL